MKDDAILSPWVRGYQERGFSFRELQRDQTLWVNHNFPDRPSWHPLLGAVEELGELAHAHLKEIQGIRKHENHEAQAKDAIGDVIIYLADYCTARGWDMGEIVEAVWAKVRTRDWQADPERAHEGTNLND